MKTWMINYFNVVRCHPLYAKSQSNHVTWTSCSLLHEKNPKTTKPRKRYCLSSAFRERDSRWSKTRTNAFHPYFQSSPVGDTVLHRAPKSLGSALAVHLLNEHCATSELIALCIIIFYSELLKIILFFYIYNLFFCCCDYAFIFLFFLFLVFIIISNVYFTSFYVKHFELPLCMKCANKLPCLKRTVYSPQFVSNPCTVI